MYCDKNRKFKIPDIRRKKRAMKKQLERHHGRFFLITVSGKVHCLSRNQFLPKEDKKEPGLDQLYLPTGLRC